MAFALHEFHGVPQMRAISELTGQIGLSAKRFIQVFSGKVDLTPKLFPPAPSLSESAASGGRGVAGRMGGVNFLQYSARSFQPE